MDNLSLDATFELMTKPAARILELLSTLPKLRRQGLQEIPLATVECGLSSGNRVTGHLIAVQDSQVILANRLVDEKSQEWPAFTSFSSSSVETLSVSNVQSFVRFLVDLPAQGPALSPLQFNRDFAAEAAKQSAQWNIPITQGRAPAPIYSEYLENLRWYLTSVGLARQKLIERYGKETLGKIENQEVDFSEGDEFLAEVKGATLVLTIPRSLRGLGSVMDVVTKAVDCAL